MDHVGTGLGLVPSPGLNVQVDAVNAVVSSPLGHHLGHALGLLLGGEPVPGVGLVAVGVPTSIVLSFSCPESSESDPPMANMILVSAGTAPSTPVPRDPAEARQ